MTRREPTTTGGAAAAAGFGGSALAQTAAPAAIERWGVAELAFQAEATGNPFDVALSATFSQGGTTVTVPGFHDGGSTWRIRFSPPETGSWTWRTESDLAGLGGREGRFEVIAPSATAPRPGRDRRRIPFRPCRRDALPSDRHHQLRMAAPARGAAAPDAGAAGEDRLQQDPHAGVPNTSVATNEALHPYERTGPGDRDHDLTRFNPAFFQRLDACVTALGARIAGGRDPCSIPMTASTAS